MWSIITHVIGRAGATCAIIVLAVSWASCGAHTTIAATTPTRDTGLAWLGMGIERCSVIPEPQATPAPRQSQANVYVSDYQTDLYAIVPESGAIRWCDQFSVTGPPPPGFLLPSPSGAGTL